VAAAAVLGGLTTLNALITSYSRTIMRAGRDEVLSLRLAAIHPRTKVPHWSILTLSLPPILLVPVAPSAVALSVFLSLIILFGGFISAIALWNLPKRFPEAYENSVYRLPMPVLKLTAIGSAVSSVVVWLLVVVQALPIIGAIVFLGVLGYGYYRYRVAAYAKRGVDLRRRLALLHEQESADAGVTPESSADAPVPVGGRETVDAQVEAATAEARGRGVTVRPPPRRIAVGTLPPSRRPSRASARTAGAPRSGTDGASGSGWDGGGRHGNGVGDGHRGGNGHGGADDGSVTHATRAAEALAAVPGLGPARTTALLEHFGSVEAVRDADVDELTDVAGVGDRLARTIKSELR
jgi:uncharacterized membrane protein YgcG